MEKAKTIFLSKLRDKNISRHEFRETACTLAEIIAHETLEHVETEKIDIETPIASAQGIKIKPHVILIPILRSGITMLEPFLKYFKDATVGIVGLKRDEETAIAHMYYNNIPPIPDNHKIIILDPMIATGGTAISTLEILKKRGIKEKNIIFASIISAPEGLETIRSDFPDITILTAGIDDKLSKDKFIVPGLGDFGDRYFGTE